MAPQDRPVTGRRDLLALAGTLGTVALAGCTSSAGANPFLKLESGLDEPVTLRVVVQLADAGEVTTDEGYEVPARSVRRVRVLGNDRYRVTVRGLADDLTFECEPTCQSATTAVFVTPERGLEAAVRGCPD